MVLFNHVPPDLTIIYYISKLTLPKVGAMCFFSLGAGHKAGSRGQSAASTRSRPNHGEAASHGRFFGGVVAMEVAGNGQSNSTISPPATTPKRQRVEQEKTSVEKERGSVDIDSNSGSSVDIGSNSGSSIPPPGHTSWGPGLWRPLTHTYSTYRGPYRFI